MVDENNKKKKFVKPLETAEADKVKPFIEKIEGTDYKYYVEKLGYPWELDDQSRSGQADRVKIAQAKLDNQGDVVGDKKFLNIHSAISPKALKQLFDNILAVKDKPLIKPEKA